MSQVKISELPVADALDGSEDYAVVQDGVTKKATGGPIAGAGDAIRVYNTDPQSIPSATNTKVVNFDMLVNPANGWPIADYGDFSGGSSFEWDQTNHRFRCLRKCVVLPFVNADVDAIDVRIVDPATGKTDPAAPVLSYFMRGSFTQILNDAILVPATRAIGSGYGYGGGNALLSPFVAQAGEYVEFWVRATATVNLIYADVTLRNIGNVV